MAAIGRDEALRLAEAYTTVWNTGSPEAVAGFFAADGGIVINNGEPWRGRAGVTQMAAGFFADVPDLALACDAVRAAGDHVVFLWTFHGTHATTKRRVRVSGWEEWDLDGGHKIKSSRGWYDAEDYARQISGAA
jgi:uncharacterized protein (TIGR02246 family)